MKILLSSLIIILLFSGAPNAQSLQSGNDPASLLQQAETYFHERKNGEAREAFERFLSRYPQEPESARAVFRIAQLDFRGRSYVAALRSFQYFLETFPHSTWVYHAQLKMAQCYFWLERYAEAEPIFKTNIQINPDVAQKWQAYTFLGILEEKRENYEKAIGHLKDVYLKTQDPKLKQFVLRNLESIVNDKMDRSSLEKLTRTMRDEYPADLALQRLISEYRAERDLGNYQIALQSFVERFPQHPKRSIYQAALDGFKEDHRRVLKLGAVLPLSGKRALIGQQVLQGIQMAFNGLTPQEKSQLELVVKDSGLGRSVEQVVTELALDPNIIGIVGPVLSHEVQKVVPILEKYQLPVFTPSASSSGLADLSPYVYRNALTKEVQALFLARHAVNNLNLYRFAVIFPEEPYGETMRTVFEKEVKALGGHIVNSLSYKTNQNDFRDMIFKIGGLSDDRLKKKIRNHIKTGRQAPPLNDKGIVSRPLVEGGVFTDDNVEGLKVSLELNYDAIFIPGYFDKVGLLVPQLVFYNIENVLLMGGNGWHSQELVDNARNYLKSVLFVDGFFAGSEDPVVRPFVEAYRTSFGEDPTILSAQSYDTSRIMIQTILKGNGNRKRLKQGLLEVRQFPGVTGITHILKNGDTEKNLTRLTVDEGFIVPVR